MSHKDRHVLTRHRGAPRASPPSLSVAESRSRAGVCAAVFVPSPTPVLRAVSSCRKHSRALFTGACVVISLVLSSASSWCAREWPCWVLRGLCTSETPTDGFADAPGLLCRLHTRTDTPVLLSLSPHCRRPGGCEGLSHGVGVCISSGTVTLSALRVLLGLCMSSAHSSPSPIFNRTAPCCCWAVRVLLCSADSPDQTRGLQTFSPICSFDLSASVVTSSAAQKVLMSMKSRLCVRWLLLLVLLVSCPGIPAESGPTIMCPCVRCF